MRNGCRPLLCSASITSRLHQDVDYIAVLIDRPPQILQLAVDSKEDLVQMPVVAQPALASLQFADIICAKLLTPPSNGFIGYENAPFRQKILDVSEAEAETMVGPDRCCQLKLFGTSLGRLETSNSKSLGRCYRSPDLEGPRSQESVMSRSQQMSRNAK